MLYRPMVPGDPDILFSGKVHTDEGKVSYFEAEATHLTCFLGGMLGMGAKLFDIEHDLEIAKRLTDGCVWAYEATKLGIMPETAGLIRCDKVSDCHWNETLWLQALDPLYAEREEMIKTYETRKANLEAQKFQEKLAAEAKLAAEEADAEAAKEAEMVEKMTASFNSTGIEGVDDVDVDSPPPVSTRYEDDIGSSSDMASGSKDKSSIVKRKVDDEKAEHDLAVTPTDGNISQERLQQKLKDTEVELEGASPGRDIETPSSYVPEIPTPGEMILDPERPLTHEEYVARKIENEGLPPGLVSMWRMYILR
jgi:mannosyl-oligosaccharide alpha-1,2-mannosidase